MLLGIIFPKNFNIIMYQHKFYDVISGDVAKVIMILFINIFGKSGIDDARSNVVKFFILDVSRSPGYTFEWLGELRCYTRIRRFQYTTSLGTQSGFNFIVSFPLTSGSN